MRPFRTLLKNSALLLVGASLACVAAFEGLAQRPAAEPRPRVFDVYEHGTPEDERRLDRFAAQLRMEPRARAYVISYGARRRRHHDADIAGRTLRWVRSDLEQRGIKPDRVVTVEGGISEKAVIELWVVPPGAPAPRARPTAGPGEVVVCPDIYVSGEQYVFRPAGPLEFAASIPSAPGLRPTFGWSVFGGRLVGGQGTGTIKVEPAGARVSVFVEVGGLAPECENEARGVTDIGVVPYRFDEYGDIRIGDEKARLDHLALQLQREPSFRAYLIGYGGRRGRRGEGQTRAARAKDYLVNVRGIAENLIVTINGGYREEMTLELWLATAGGEPPAATPTVDEKYARPRTGR